VALLGGTRGVVGGEGSKGVGSSHTEKGEQFVGVISKRSAKTEDDSTAQALGK